MTDIPLHLKILITVLAVLQMFIKGVALWRAAKSGDRRWFIAFIILFYLNTLGIVELIYLFYLSKPRLTLHEVKRWLPKHRKHH